MLMQTNLVNLMSEYLVTNPKTDYEKAYNDFLIGQKAKHGKYFSLGNALVYRTIMTEDNGTIQKLGENIIARKLNGTIIGNSSILPLIGRRSSFGRESLNRSVTDIQTLLSKHFTMIPFNVFTESGLDIKSFTVIEKNESETVVVEIDNVNYEENYDRNLGEYIDNGQPKKVDETRHFTGSCLFKVENNIYLFDIDREEIKHKIFNAFLVKIPENVSTVNDAYSALMPNEVKEAIKNKVKVDRQGEWFFIKQNNKQINEISDNLVIKPLSLQVNNNRPNRAELGFTIDGVTYVKGTISHSGREHRELQLKGWYRAIPNTATESFTITGDID